MEVFCDANTTGVDEKSAIYCENFMKTINSGNYTPNLCVVNSVEFTMIEFCKTLSRLLLLNACAVPFSTSRWKCT